MAPPGWTEERRRDYFDTAEQAAAGLRGVDPKLDALFDDSLAEARRLLGVAE